LAVFKKKQESDPRASQLTVIAVADSPASRFFLSSANGTSEEAGVFN